jgi:hypothetical protein
VETEVKCVRQDKTFPLVRTTKVENKHPVYRFLQLDLSVCLFGTRQCQILKIFQNFVKLGSCHLQC